jgi:general nucleoside transport system permease protein
MGVLLTDVVQGVLSTMMILSPFYVFAGLGEILSEKSGVVNLGIEGIALMSLIATFIVDFATGSPWLGLLAAMGMAALIGTVFAFFTVRVRLDQIVMGLAIYLFGLGMSFVVYYSLYECPTCSGAPAFVNIQPINIPLLSGIPIVGPALFSQNILVYFSLALVVVVAYFLNRTSLGLRIKAVGENPKAADNMGVNVNKVRFLSVLVGAIMAGVAGAYFAFGFVQSFQYDIIAGRGFIALAIIYLANWGPYKTLFAALSFNVVYATQSEIVAISSVALAGSSQLFNMLPYVYLLALIPILGRRSRPPRFLLKPYRKG